MAKKLSIRAHFAVQLSLCFVITSTVNAEVECPHLQYLQIGKGGKVTCSFSEGTYGALWYNSSDVLNSESIAALKGSQKSGYGYTSGEYDVDSSGSLLIANVDVEDGTVFRVIKIPSTDADVPRVHYVITVVTTVSPTEEFPVINACDDECSCLIEVNGTSSLSCHVRNARPTVPVSWFERKFTSDVSDDQITSLFEVEHYGLTSTSTATTVYANGGSALLSLLVCRVIDAAGLLNKTESFVLVENKDNAALDVKPNKRYIIFGAKMSLPCKGATEASLLVWKVQWGSAEDLHRPSDTIVYIINGHIKYYLEDFHLGDNGTLLLDVAKISHDGVYYCISKTVEREVVTAYDVSVYVNPVPAYPVVEGCSSTQYCVLEVPAEGELTCSVYGVRPAVVLKWRPFYEQDSSVFVITGEQHRTDNEGGLSNVFLTVKFSVSGSKNRVTMECRATEETAELFDLSTKLDLLISYHNHEFTTESSLSLLKAVWILTVLNTMVVFVLIIVITVISRRRVRERGNQYGEGGRVQKDEEITCLPITQVNGEVCNTTPPSDMMTNGPAKRVLSTIG